MKNIDEKSIIKRLSRILFTPEWAPEDAEHVGYGDLIESIDSFVASTDMPKGMDYYSVGWKAVVSSISDLICKGASPIYISFSMVVPKDASVDNLLEMANGIRDASSYFRAKIGKGDINTGEELILTVSSTGIANKFIKRRGAEPGDYIVASDYFGLERLGLDALLGRHVGDKEMINKAKNRFLRPTIDYKKILWCINKGYVKASIDSSDGLAISLYELADLNNAKVVVENIPMYPGLDEFLNDDKQMLKYVFYGGEEYITILVIDGSRWRDFTRESDRYGFSFIKVGRMYSGSGVYLKLDHEEELLDRRGWDPFVL